MKPVDAPDPAVLDQIREKIKQPPLDKMDAAFMVELYQMDGKAAKAIGQILGEDGMHDKNMKIGEVRKQMDLAVWKEILKKRGIKVETTNQGKSNGARSDLDYTLYHVAEEAGVAIKDLIAEHTAMWLDLHKIGAEKLEIKVMNGGVGIR